jgi:DNA-damage-inducible protein D
MTGLDFVINALDGKRRAARNGKPYWFGREIMEVLSYKDWRDFREVIEKSKVSCDMAGNFSSNHFVRLDEKVEIGSGAFRTRENYVLSKYGCYLVAMNGDPGKPEIATAQAYFADQTFKQEIQNALTEDERRLLLRDRVKDANKKLGGAAKEAGVRSQMFGVFQDAGYKGLYGGLGYREIKKKKGVDDKEDLLDCIGRAELAANEFRITQAEEKLRIDKVKGEQAAIETHKAVGRKVRKAIEDIGGTMPELLPSAPSIKKLGAQHAREAKKLKADNKEN